MKKTAGMMFCLLLGTGASCFADTFEEGKTALGNKNYLDAAAKFTLACKNKDAKGCFELGEMYEKGDGIAQNKYAAASFYADACTLGYPKGCANMGLNTDTP